MVRPGPGQHSFPEVTLERDEHFRFSLQARIKGSGRVEWAGSTVAHLAVDSSDVLRVEQHHLLVDEMRPEVAALPRAAAQRQRGLVLLEDPAASVGGPELRLHVAAGRTGCSSVLLCEPPLSFEANGGAAPTLAGLLGRALPGPVLLSDAVVSPDVCSVGTIDGLARVPVSSRVFGPSFSSYSLTSPLSSSWSLLCADDVTASFLTFDCDKQTKTCSGFSVTFSLILFVYTSVSQRVGCDPKIGQRGTRSPPSTPFLGRDLQC